MAAVQAASVPAVVRVGQVVAVPPVAGVQVVLVVLVVWAVVVPRVVEARLAVVQYQSAEVPDVEGLVILKLALNRVLLSEEVACQDMCSILPTALGPVLYSAFG